MNFLFFGWVYGAPILAGIIAWFNPFFLVRWIMTASAIVPLVGYAAQFWTGRYFNSVDCEGNVMKGIECPKWTAIGRVAFWHDVLSLYAVPYVIGIFPFILFLTVIVLGLKPDRWRR